jgi:predicted PurR-regulated permease PerM
VGEQIVDHSGEVLGLVAQLGVGRGLGHVAASLADLFAVPILSFLLLKDGPEIREHLIELLRIGPANERLLRDAHVLMLEYMRSLLLLCFVTLVSFTAVLSLLQVRYSVLLAFLAFVLEFIPVVGPLAAAGVILGVGWFTGATGGHLLAVGSFLLGFRVFQDYVLGPIVMRRGVQLHPLLVMFGIFAGADIGGVAGILLSVPILALLRLIWYEIRARSAADENSWNAVTV